MAGAVRKSAFLICTVPRLVGLRLHTLAVKAGKLCSGSPNASSDKGCTWYWMLGYMLVAAAREGTQLRRRHAHGAAAFEHVFEPDLGLAHQQSWPVVLSVGTPCTL